MMKIRTRADAEDLTIANILDLWEAKTGKTGISIYISDDRSYVTCGGGVTSEHWAGSSTGESVDSAIVAAIDAAFIRDLRPVVATIQAVAG